MIRTMTTTHVAAGNRAPLPAGTDRVSPACGRRSEGTALRRAKSCARAFAGGLAALLLTVASPPAQAGCVGAALPAAGGGMPLQGTYVTPFQDANKSGPWPHDTDPVTGDSSLCWAATAANMLAYGGWGVGAGQNDAQAIFAGQLNPRYANVGGFTRDAVRDYFETYHPALQYLDYYASRSVPTPLGIDGLLASGNGLGLRLNYTTETGAHALSVYGTVRDPRTHEYTGLILADNEDNATRLVALDAVEVTAGFTRWNLPGYWGQPDVAGLDILRSVNPFTTLNQVWTDDVPPISEALADYLKAHYVLYPAETGINDAPLTGFDGRLLTSGDTGWEGLRYLPGPAVADQTPGNGIDELVAFSFDMPQIAGRSIASAELILNLTPKDPSFATDLLLFADNGSRTSDAYGNAILRDLVLDMPVTVSFPLNAMPSSDGLQDLRPLLADGTLDVVFGDDAILSWVALTVTLVTEAPEPPTLWALAAALAGLVTAARRKPGAGARRPVRGSRA